MGSGVGEECLWNAAVLFFFFLKFSSQRSACSVLHASHAVPFDRKASMARLLVDKRA